VARQTMSHRSLPKERGEGEEREKFEGESWGRERKERERRGER
jgi:hypothetical protein